MSFVSVIIPIYKAENYIGDLVNRVGKVRNKLIGMGFDLELVCICDDPIDNSVRVLKEIESVNDFITVHVLSSNVGQHLATSAGILAAKGGWIVTMDEDLQHPPEAIIEMINVCCRNSLDICYAKGRGMIHSKSLYRDVASTLAKKIANIMTGIDYTRISSFRVIRAETARNAASAIDRNHYLDVALNEQVSNKRIKTIKINMTDRRSIKEASNYDLKSLARHFTRFIFSTPLSISRLLIGVVVFIWVPIALSSVILMGTAVITGAYKITPGWLSLMLLIVFTTAYNTILMLIIIKQNSINMQRGLAMLPYNFINRETDKEVEDKLKNDQNR
tara:strand:- start:55 stop:1050 length:996 start_codon:yes stop_codon:yes gene_type:complete